MIDKQLQDLREMCEASLKEHSDQKLLEDSLWCKGFHCGAVTAYTTVLSWLDKHTKKSEKKFNIGDRVRSTVSPHVYEYLIIDIDDELNMALLIVAGEEHICSQDILEVVGT